MGAHFRGPVRLKLVPRHFPKNLRFLCFLCISGFCFVFDFHSRSFAADVFAFAG